MRGIGEILSAPLDLPALPAVLVNPGVAVPTKEVFARWTPAANHDIASNIDVVAKLTNCEQLLQFLDSSRTILKLRRLHLSRSLPMC